MCAAVGLGLMSRTFSPGPRAIPGYASNAIGSVRFDGDIQPAPHVRLDLAAEESMGMTTQLMSEIAPTSLRLWQATASWGMVHGRVIELGPIIGLGQRSFVIESKDPSRSPDGNYVYIVAGARLSAALGKRTTLSGTLGVDPVVGGAQATMPAYGQATRWAIDVGVALDYRPASFLFLRAQAGWQRFAWSFDQAGVRGAGGAVDSYVGAVLSLGAEY
jgi:hypothetical protein